MGNNAGKKLRRCKPHSGAPNKVKRGMLYKQNGPKSRDPVSEPNPRVVEYYARLEAAARERREIRHRAMRESERRKQVAKRQRDRGARQDLEGQV